MPFPDDLLQPFTSMRAADLVDIGLVALLLYGVLTWLRRSASPLTARRFLAIGMVFGAVYALANTLDLYLVESVLSVFFLVFLVAVVIVFQAEIRRVMTRFGSPGFLSPRVRAGSSTVDALVEAASHMAAQRIGALIAVKGREPWDDHVTGGVPLDGVVSQPLLYSLFDPATAGHDGAVLLEGSQVVRFAAHLPLAAALPEVSRFGGTRHAAAVGLTEHCDALVIVVSEERGVISIAQGGKLSELSSANELASRLRAFWSHETPQGRSRLRRLWPSVQTALVSLAVAMLLWLFFAYTPGNVSRTVEAAVEFRNLPDTWQLVSSSPDIERLTLTGPERAFRELDRKPLAVSFDLSDPQEGGQHLSIGEGQLDLPSSLRLSAADPETVFVETQRLVPLELPVSVATLPQPGTNTVIDELRAEPAKVVLLAPRDQIESARRRHVWTDPVDLGEVKGTATLKKRLVLPPGWRLAEGQAPDVTVHVSVRPQ